MTSVSFDFGTLRTLRLALANLVEDLERAQYDFQGSLGYSDIGEIVSLITQDHRQVAIDRALRYADDLLDGLRGSIANVAAKQRADWRRGRKPGLSNGCSPHRLCRHNASPSRCTAREGT